MGKYFGTDGFRGEANRELTAMHAFQLGQFLGSFYGSQARRARVVIGKDPRASGYMLEDALCAGLTSAGADAYLLHVTPTPSVSYVARTEGFDCGVMISASHNPYWDNGLKLVNAQGEKMEDAVIERAEAFLDAGVVIFKGKIQHFARMHVILPKGSSRRDMIAELRHEEGFSDFRRADE